VYMLGVTVQSSIMDISVWQAIKVSVVFLPGDFVKAVIAAILVPRLYRSLTHVITPAVKHGKISNARYRA
ncbi:biotin transporter BioY, partial [Bacillus pseudomycoides]|uniref:biotin transporter BioY n=1 Tax=Bacillus pseudomycoides TaxID=64104 RepID=UPI0028401D60